MELDRIDIKLSENGRHVVLTVNGKQVAGRRCMIDLSVESAPVVVIEFAAPNLSIEGEFEADVNGGPALITAYSEPRS